MHEKTTVRDIVVLMASFALNVHAQTV